MEIEWQRDLAWTSSRISAIAKRLSLGRTKVYKWTWDRKKKEHTDLNTPGNTITSGVDQNNVRRSGLNELTEQSTTTAPLTTSLANRFRIEMARYPG